jgi:hypothetical protein
MYVDNILLNQYGADSVANLMKWWLTNRITEEVDSEVAFGDGGNSRHAELEYNFATRAKLNEVDFYIPEELIDKKYWFTDGKKVVPMAHYSELAKMILVDFTEALTSRMHNLFTQENPWVKDFAIKVSVDFVEK